MEGWILLHRKIQDSDIWTMDGAFDMRSAWIDLLLMVNHEDKSTVFDMKPVIIKRGQCVTSVRKLSVRWGWGKDKTLHYLRLLESLGMIKKQSDSRRTLLTIENYDVYQCDPSTGQTVLRTVSRQSADTDQPQTKNIKNEKKEKNIKNIYGEYKHVRLTDSERDRLFNDYGESETLEAIRFLDEYIEMKGYKAKNHYLCIRKWVFDAIKRDKPQVNSVFDAWANA